MIPEPPNTTSHSQIYQLACTSLMPFHSTEWRDYFSFFLSQILWYSQNLLPSPFFTLLVFLCYLYIFRTSLCTRCFSYSFKSLDLILFSSLFFSCSLHNQIFWHSYIFISHSLPTSVQYDCCPRHICGNVFHITGCNGHSF